MRQGIYLILILLILLGSSCKDNVICPAFQSTYILNDSIRFAKYSLFGTDSLPKYTVASRRNKHGINKRTSLFRKNYDLKTAPKVNVLGPPKKDPLFVDEGEFLASDFDELDSLGNESNGADSVRTIPSAVASGAEEPSGPKYKYRYDRSLPYNHEQEYYNKYYGELFIDNRPPPVIEGFEIPEGYLDEDSTTAVKPGKRGLKGLFKKKREELEAEGGAEEELEIGEEVVEEEEEGGGQ